MSEEKTRSPERTAASCVALLNDALVGIARALGPVPGGTALVEDTLRTVARVSAERLLVDLDPPATEDILAGLRYYLSERRLSGLLESEEASVEETASGRVRVRRESLNCVFRNHCTVLAERGFSCVCPRRLYAEQAVAAVTGRSVGSIVLPRPDDQCCAFELFALSADMLRPIERLTQKLSSLTEERAVAKGALNRIEAQYKLILETIGDAILVISNEGKLTYMNPRACGVFAMRMEQALGHRFEKGGAFGRLGDLVIEAAGRLGKWEGMTEIENRDGDHIHNIYLTRFSPVHDDARKQFGTLIVLEDVTREELLRRALAAQARGLERTVTEKTRELQAANSKLEVLARTDSLTGLPNRRTFDEILRAELQRARRYGHSTGVLMVDVDDFKQVNDKLGHQTGDEVLILVAAILSKSVRSTDTVARWGGDEFAILLPQSAARECEAVARRIGENTLIENAAGDRVKGLVLSLSVGYASGESEGSETLLASADRMMYDHKAARKARKSRDGAGSR